MDLLHHLQSALGATYALQRELGGGGMSRVFVAEEVQLGRMVVMKVVAEELAGGMSVERFRREIRLAAMLQHPHIVPVLTAGDANGLLYYTMPLIEGESLRARVERDGAFSLEDAITVLRDVASALEYAHAKGIVHRDVKPDNVLLTGAAAVVTDFGIAKALEHSVIVEGSTALTQAGLSIGTPEYMAPEQALADPDVDHRADLYAFGCLAYEVLTGKSPFAGRAHMKLVAAHLAEAPARLETVRSGLPRALAAVVMKCLEKDPAARPENAAQVLSAIDAALASIATTPPAKSDERRSIAVLPFRNLSPDPDVDYLADGLMEEIIADLSRVRALTVISRSSAMRFKAADRDLRSVARELDVRYLLEGSLRRAGSTLRVTAQLVDMEEDVNLWAERFDGSLDDVFAIQENIAHSIVGALQVWLSPAERLGLRERPIPDLLAYDCYLRARHEIWSFTRRGAERAIVLLTHALEAAGDNALILGTLGVAHAFLAQLGVDGAGNGARAVEFAQAAFVIDQESPQGHTVMGLVALASADLSASAKSLRRVLEREPSNVEVMLTLGNVYLCAGRAERAEPLLRRCAQLDPLLPLTHLMLAYLDLMRGHAVDAVAHYEKAFALQDHPIPLAVWGFEMGLAAAGRVEDACAMADRLDAGARADPHGRMALLLRHALRGERDEMFALVTPEFQALAETQGYLARDLAGYHALVGSTEKALDWLERAIHGGFYNYPYFLNYSHYDSLRGHARFAELMAQAKTRWEAFDE